MSYKRYIDSNKQSWNKRTEAHLKSAFYDVEGFLQGKSSLNSIELDLLGDVSGKSILHLQCHFGQDSISLSRMGAKVTGIDLSDKAIESANEMAKLTHQNTRFICCDLYDLPNHLDEKFDVIFSSYGTIGWLPDLEKWAEIVQHFLKPNGQFIFVEFHPVVWMFDDRFQNIAYNYFNSGPIIETLTGSYVDREADMELESITWNHSLSEVIQNLTEKGLKIDNFQEFDYSPYDCFEETIEFEPHKYRIKHLGNKIPLVFALVATKS